MLAWNHFLDIEEERTFRERIEDKFHLLLFFFDKFRQGSLIHHKEILVFMSRFNHIFTGNLFFALPFIVADVKGSHLVIRITAGLQDGLVQIQKGGFAVYFNFTDKAIYFIGDKFNSVKHILSI
ncbi:hypothetical protein EVA_10827 [gut metagenome]|uniref:Uncharacterized protein n=1 Tax=gut metagenome TaxID=749906 RepID=J9GML8_9ZZZZ